MPPSSYRLQENTRFIFNSTPIKKPFSSILYVCRRSTLYCSILRFNSSKYSAYLNAESAFLRYVSMPNAHRNTRSMWLRLMKRSAHNLPACFPAISNAKLRIISRVGGNPRAVRQSMYSISSLVCVLFSSREFSDFSAIVPCTPRQRFDSVERLQPYSSATWVRLIGSPIFQDLRASSASSIGAILVE